MKITIPVAGVELRGITNQSVVYPKQLPIWPTRPMMIKIYPDKISGVGQPIIVAVVDQGTAVHTFELPYEEVIDLDMSFACPLMPRADRQKSTELDAGSSLAFYSRTSEGLHTIVLGIFHSDLTYWHTIPGNQASLPEPPKIKMPGQEVDIYYPFATAPGVTFPVVAEPADDADPTAAIMPTVYELGKTLDVRYLKKLTIKDVWGEGLDHVIEYENRNWNRANEDDALLCALRVRWNMQNGEWFWDAFKNFFWSNNFTYLRGLGGATEQAEITVNMEYGPDKYAVYQQLMISSQILMELNIPGINQHQYKVFRAEVVSDSGARWSGSTRTYRQQVRFRTMELQDNYISPVLPDSPAPIPVQFSAQFNPWTIGAAYAEGLINSIYSNAAWEVQREPNWFASGDKLPLEPAEFEQGGYSYVANTNWESLSKYTSAHVIRTKKPIETRGKTIKLISHKDGYKYAAILLDATGKATYHAVKATENGGLWPIIGAHSFLLEVRKIAQGNTTAITPAEMSTAGIWVQDANKLFDYPAGSSNLTATVAANTGAQRTDNLVLKSLAGAATYTIPVTQEAGV